MAITVSDALQLSELKVLKLVAGINGLNNIIEAVNILDYEYDLLGKAVDKPLQRLFDPNSFVLTSLMFAKDCPQLIIKSVKRLIADGVSAIAVNTAYFTELPDEVVEYANEKALPIFLFDRDDVYFEDAITSLNKLIDESNNYDLIEEKLTLLVEGNLKRNSVSALAEEIVPQLTTPYSVLFLDSRERLKRSTRTRIIKSYEQQANQPRLSLFPFRHGILVCAQLGEKNQELSTERILAQLGLVGDSYIVGISRAQHRWDSFDYACKESIYAARFARHYNKSGSHYSDIGIFQLILPYCDDYWLTTHSQQIISVLKKHDEEYNTELLHTASTFIHFNGSMILTAQALHLHKNSVRYRINKIRELLNMEDEESCFYEQLSMAIRTDEITRL